MKLPIVCFMLLALMADGRKAQAANDGGSGQAIAVLDFKAVNTSSGDAAVISNFMRQALVNDGRFSVVDKTNMERILAEQAFQQTGCTEQDCAVKLGKLLNVRLMVVGQYALMGEARFLTASVVDVQTGAIEGSGMAKGFKVEDIDRVTERVVAQLLKGVSVEARKPDPEPVAEPAPKVSKPEEEEKPAEKAKKPKPPKRAKVRKPAEPIMAGAGRGRFGIGLNTPGAGIRYFFINNYAIEPRVQFETDILVFGGRLIRYIRPLGRLMPYFGAEGDIIQYDDEEVTGEGFALSAFIGGELYIKNRLSFQFDFGAAHIDLDATDVDVSVDDIRYVINLGLTYYLRRGGGK